jgi:hypothetical protein
MLPRLTSNKERCKRTSRQVRMTLIKSGAPFMSQKNGKVGRTIVLSKANKLLAFQ